MYVYMYIFPCIFFVAYFCCDSFLCLLYVSLNRAKVSPRWGRAGDKEEGKKYRMDKGWMGEKGQKMRESQSQTKVFLRLLQSVCLSPTSWILYICT